MYYYNYYLSIEDDPGLSSDAQAEKEQFECHLFDMFDDSDESSDSEDADFGYFKDFLYALLTPATPP